MKSDLTKGMFLMSTAVFLAQLLATGVMIGVIWVVQLVHYPLFASVGANEFVAYHREHVRLITFIVGPAMLIDDGGNLDFAALRPERPCVQSNPVRVPL